MDDRRPFLVGHLVYEEPEGLIHRRQLAGLRLLPLALPALQLASEIRLAPAEVPAADVVGLDVVQVGESLDDVHPERVASILGHDLRGLAGARQDVALDVFHHVEGGVVHAVVFAEREDRGDGTGAASESGQDAVLPGHVVGCREDRAGRRAPEHHLTPVRVLDEVGEVGVTSDDHLEAQRGSCAFDVFVEVLVEGSLVDALHSVASVAGSISNGRMRGGLRFRGAAEDPTQVSASTTSMTPGPTSAAVIVPMGKGSGSPAARKASRV